MDMLKLKNGLEDIKYKLQETLNLAKKIEPYAVAKSTPLSPFLTVSRLCVPFVFCTHVL